MYLIVLNTTGNNNESNVIYHVKRANNLWMESSISIFRLGKVLGISTKCQLACLQAPTNVNIVLLFLGYWNTRFGVLTLTLHLVHLVKLSRKNPLISSLQNFDFFLASQIFGENNFLTESLFFKVSVWSTLSVKVLLGSFGLEIYLRRASVAFLSLCLSFSLYSRSISIVTVAFLSTGSFLLIYSPCKPHTPSHFSITQRRQRRDKSSIAPLPHPITPRVFTSRVLTWSVSRSLQNSNNFLEITINPHFRQLTRNQ